MRHGIARRIGLTIALSGSSPAASHVPSSPRSSSHRTSRYLGSSRRPAHTVIGALAVGAIRRHQSVDRRTAASQAWLCERLHD